MIVSVAGGPSSYAREQRRCRARPRTCPYPNGNRRWVHVSSQLIGLLNPMHARLGGIHHVYANVLAMQGLETGRYADGATFVFPVLHVATTDDVTCETIRRLPNVMVKDREKFAETSGWVDEEFTGDSREPALDPQRRAECATRQVRRVTRDHVFRVFRP